MTKFILPFPPTVNSEYYQSKGRRSKSSKIKEWEKQAINALNLQNVKPVHGRVILEYALDTPDNYNRDAANYEKHVTDILVKHGILKDDCARYVRGIFIYWNDKIGNSIHITITEFKMAEC